MREIRREPVMVYTFDELSEDAKQKAIDNHRYHYVSDSYWMEHIEEELNDIGVSIVKLDIDRHCLQLRISDYGEIAKKVKEIWKEDTNLYKAAEHYQIYCDTDIYAAGDFKNDLACAYCDMFVKEYEHLTSDDYIAERLIDSGDEFYEDGETY